MINLPKKYILFIVVLFVIILISNKGPRNYIKELIKRDQTEIKKANKKIDSLKLVLKSYVPNKKYQAKIDSLKKELDSIKKIDYEKIRYIYINADFDSKFELLKSTIQEGKVE